MVKKVRGSHRSDLTNARKFTIVRSVAIALRTGIVLLSVQLSVRLSIRVN